MAPACDAKGITVHAVSFRYWRGYSLDMTCAEALLSMESTH